MSETDWERVKRNYDSDAPIPYDPEDGPYDPNDPVATQRWMDESIGQGPVQRANGTGTIKIDIADSVLDYFGAQGDDWRERINEVLKAHVEAQTKEKPELAKAS